MNPAQIEGMRRELTRLKRELLDVRIALLERKYRPDQSRDDHGRFADEGRNAAGRSAAAPSRRLGALSSRYETGGRGPGTVSKPDGDPGGVSYGSYQLATKRGSRKHS